MMSVFEWVVIYLCSFFCSDVISVSISKFSKHIIKQSCRDLHNALKGYLRTNYSWKTKNAGKYSCFWDITEYLPHWPNTLNGHQSQPLMTATGLSLIHFLLIPAAWQVSTTSVTFLYDSGASSMTNLGEATRIEIPISSNLFSTSW